MPPADEASTPIAAGEEATAPEGRATTDLRPLAVVGLVLVLRVRGGLLTLFEQKE